MKGTRITRHLLWGVCVSRRALSLGAVPAPKRRKAKRLPVGASLLEARFNSPGAAFLIAKGLEPLEAREDPQTKATPPPKVPQKRQREEILSQQETILSEATLPSPSDNTYYSSDLVASRVAHAMQFPWCRTPDGGLHPNAKKWAEGWHERRWATDDLQ